MIDEHFEDLTCRLLDAKAEACSRIATELERREYWRIEERWLQKASEDKSDECWAEQVNPPKRPVCDGVEQSTSLFPESDAMK